MRQGWEYKILTDCIEKVKYTDKIQSSDYKQQGKYPIISQEDDEVSGYWDDDNSVFKITKPIVVFGDHTRIVKYIDFNFVLGADGVKILQPIDELNAKFFSYFLKSYPIPSLGYSRHFKVIKEIQVPVPPLTTQQSIVSELDTLSQIIADYKAQLEDFDKLEQSIFYDMFGDPVKNEKGWEFAPFDTVTKSMTKGPFGSDIKKSLYVPKSSDTYKVYIQVNAINKDASLGEYYISKEYFEEKMFRFEVKPNDYLITCDGTLGKFIRLPHNIEKGIISASLLRVTLNDKILYEYFEYLWNEYMLNELIKDVRNAALKHLPSATNIGKLMVPLPPLTLQQQFADKIAAIEQMKSDTKAALQDAELLFNSRMDYWFN